MDRRDFLRAGGAALLTPALAGLLAGCSKDSNDPVSAGTGTTVKKSGTPRKRKVKLGFIALTDCASIVMAKELGYFAERDLDVSVEKRRRGRLHGTTCSTTVAQGEFVSLMATRAAASPRCSTWSPASCAPTAGA